MRARMALYLTDTSCEHREVSLNDKPSSMLEASSKGTVPVLILNSGEIIDESIDIVNWVLQQNNVFNQSLESQEIYTEEKIKLFDGDFKFNLDRYKYASRYEDADANEHRELCLQILRDLDRDKNEYQICQKRRFLQRYNPTSLVDSRCRRSDFRQDGNKNCACS